jgi:hypothetical protein
MFYKLAGKKQRNLNLKGKEAVAERTFMSGSVSPFPQELLKLFIQLSLLVRVPILIGMDT